MERPFIGENALQRQRLHCLINRITDAQLNLPMNNDWTIAAALAHLAFWDQRCLALMRKWKSSGVSPSPIDIDVTNDSLLPLWRALPARAAANLALLSAEAIDGELEEAPPDLISSIENLGERFRLYRSEHRKLHINEIEGFLKSKVGI